MSNPLTIDMLEEKAAAAQRGELIRMTSSDLTSRQRRHLRALGHHMQPVVQIGQKGLFDGLADAIEDAMSTHELIKIKVMDNSPHDLHTAALWVHDRTNARVVQLIGRVMLAYKPRKKDPDIRLPRP